MPSVPEKPAEVRLRVRSILDAGLVSYTEHARTEMKKDTLHTTDCVNVLRGGAYQPPELIGDTWRYRVTTGRITVVISMMDDDHVRVITAWRET